MILSTHGFLASSIGQFDADYVAILNYATTQGYTKPSAAQQIKQNKLLVDLKAAGIWSKLDTFAVFATDGSSDFALIDWKRKIQYTAFNSPTFTSNGGFIGNGTSSYIDTNFNPSTSGVNYTLNNAGRYFYLKTISTLGTFYEGLSASANGNGMSSSNLASNTHRINQSTNNLNSTVNSFNNIGFKSIHRNSSTNVELFQNTTQFSRTATSTSIANSNQTIFKHGLNFSNPQISLYGMGASLVSENTNFYNAVNTYITSL